MALDRTYEPLLEAHHCVILIMKSSISKKREKDV